ncbi:MAG: hypothetical protein SOU94_03725 [Acidaminococcus sp.]|uniref:hypothetical protein n=1 Tax=Acidaminococcus sp. TaxID=1872103 RepID=UPI002A74F3A0|nr:hypothetical protein [Acidaminococcus sp.]MDY2738923.1 hypothetical protein [Acidaminococcus sp.]
MADEKERDPKDFEKYGERSVTIGLLEYRDLLTASVQHSDCWSQKWELKDKIRDLEKKVEKQKEIINRLYAQIHNMKEEGKWTK